MPTKCAVKIIYPPLPYCPLIYDRNDTLEGLLCMVVKFYVHECTALVPSIPRRVHCPWSRLFFKPRLFLKCRIPLIPPTFSIFLHKSSNFHMIYSFFGGALLLLALSVFFFQKHYWVYLL